MRTISKFFLLLLVCDLSTAQTFLNGSFEANSAGTFDQINVSNTTFNSLITDVFAFGTQGNLDLIQSSTWGGGGAQNCKWYVALTGGGTDAITLKLSAPLVSGNTYTMSFWDRSDAQFPSNPIQISLSLTNNTMGTVIYTGGPTVNSVWTQRTFTFVAPNNGDNVCVTQSGAAATTPWVHVDNFVLNNTGSTVLNVTSSTSTICAGSSAVFTVSGNMSFTWSPAASLSSANGTIVTANPTTTTIYTVNGSTGNCSYMGQITLNVVPKVSVVLTPSSVCAGKSATLAATGSSSYSWAPTTGLSAFTGSAVVAAPASSINYTVTGTGGTCTSSAVASLQVNAAPQLSVAGSATAICIGSKNTLSVSGASSYTWSPGSQQTSTFAINSQTSGVFVYTVVGVGTNSCTASRIFTVAIQTCAGMMEMNKTSFQVYPNPASQTFYIDCNGDMELDVFSNVGELVQHLILSANDHGIKVGPLEPGLYILSDKTGSVRKKVLVLK